MKFQGLRVAAYARSSTNAPHRLTEELRQLARIRRYCAANKMTIVSSAIEGAKSAVGAGDDRRDFEELLDRACSAGRPFDAIVVSSASRVARRAGEFELYMDRLGAAGVMLITVEEGANHALGEA
jgi:DNA invertase Pin-like site-specific DNA recombinase